MGLLVPHKVIFSNARGKFNRWQTEMTVSIYQHFDSSASSATGARLRSTSDLYAIRYRYKVLFRMIIIISGFVFKGWKKTNKMWKMNFSIYFRKFRWLLLVISLISNVSNIYTNTGGKLTKRIHLIQLNQC